MLKWLWQWTTAAISVPDREGLEYTLEGKAQYTITAIPLHYTLPDDRMHYSESE